MSFVYGDLNTADFPWLAAKLKEWPSYPVDTTIYQYVRGDGAYYRKPRVSSIEWQFSLEVTAANWEQAQEYATKLSTLLHNSRDSLQKFVPEGQNPWEWQALCSKGPSWRRDSKLWFGSQGVCRMSAEISFTTPDPYGYAPEEVVPVLTYDGTKQAYKPSGPTLFYYPVVEFVVHPKQDSVVKINDIEISLGGIPANDQIVLDFKNQKYYQENQFTHEYKGSVVNRMQKFKRLRSNPDGTVEMAVSINTGIISAVMLKRRRRRV